MARTKKSGKASAPTNKNFAKKLAVKKAIKSKKWSLPKSPSSSLASLFGAVPKQAWNLTASQGGKGSSSSATPAKTKKSKKKQKRQNAQNAQHAQNNTSNNTPVRKFKLRIPIVGPNAPPVPWAKRTVVLPPPPRSGKTKTTTISLLNSISVHGPTMDLLNQELEAFGEYVRLTPQECHARDKVVQVIQELACQQFGSSPQQCRIFGSFASKSICTFESDVDVALHGIVEQQSDDEDEDENFSSVEESKEERLKQRQRTLVSLPPTQHPNRRKQEKILRWKSALNEVAKEQYSGNDGLEMDKREVPEEAKTMKYPTSTDNTLNGEDVKNNHSSEDDETPLPLFLIDRIGIREEEAAQTVTSSSSSSDSNSSCVEEENEVQLEQSKQQQLEETVKVNVESLGAPEENTNFVNKDDEVVVLGTKDDPILIDASDDEEEEGHDKSDALRSDDDTADKLEGLKSPSRENHPRLSSRYAPRKDGDHCLQDAMGLDGTREDIVESFEGGNEDNDDDYEDEEYEEEDEEEEEEEEETITKPRSQSVISLSSSTTCSVEEQWDESAMEVSFVTEPRSSLSSQSSRRSSSNSSRMGPTGETRTLVVRALNTLSRRLRKTQFANQLTVRKWARVPIINMETVFGYECDIALGGHSGTDTSSYASAQIARFKSFATVVLVLKVILNQQGLDKPFTGGLGSFKLYVLVAYHIERHIELGGSDNAAEVLFMFFFRYGDIGGGKIHPSSRTTLSQLIAVESKDGGSADMGGVYQVENCIQVFKACWLKLRRLLREPFNPRHSILRYIIDASELQSKRSLCRQKASQISQFQSAGFLKQRMNGEFLTVSSLGLRAADKKPNEMQAKLKSNQECSKHQLDTDDEVEQLMSGYGITESHGKERKRSRREGKGEGSRRAKRARNKAFSTLNMLGLPQGHGKKVV